ncbi:MAG: S8 family serine peptidase [Planctomycetes bacterium]|nr:S8 family serine peptidase [Planctomycetota bacterium]
MKRELVLAAGILAMPAVAYLCAGRTTPAPAPATPEAPVAARPSVQLVVGLTTTAADLDVAARAAAAHVGGALRGLHAAPAFAVVEAPGELEDGPDLVRALEGLPGVAWAELNRTAAPSIGTGRCSCQGAGGPLPPAPDIHDLAEVKAALRLAEAWLDAPAKGEQVVVGVVDTGLDPNQVALRGACEPAIDLLEEGGAGADQHGHGTSMAAIIAGRRPSPEAKSGFEGVAPKARVLPVRVADERGGAPLDRVARGIVAAADRGAKVIYVGLGVRGRSPTLAAAVAQARKLGALVVAPAGNDGLDQVRSPAAEPGAFAVAGTSSRGDGLALCTNLSAEVDLCAPAEFVPAPHKDRTCFTEGTSSSAALVAGVAALALSRSPALDPAALERCLRAGAAPIAQVEGTVLARRVPVRALDAAGAVARAAAEHAEVGLEARLVPAQPSAGEAVRLEVTVTNLGHVPLARVQVAAAPEGARTPPPAEAVTDLAPGAAQVLSFAFNVPAEGPGGAWVEATAAPAPAATGPMAPCLAATVATWTATARPQASYAVVGVRLVEPITLERPEARFEVTVENVGSGAGKGTLQAAVDGARVVEAPLALAPGERAVREVRWALPDGRSPSTPVHFEAYVEVPGDLLLDDDIDSLEVALQDPSLPLDPMYRQAGDVDFGCDAPWRLAADRGHLPFLVFVPSIGRPSRYATFHETLAIRRGAVNSTTSRARTATGVAGRIGGDLVTYTAATFIKELGEAAAGDDQAVRRFFDKMLTTDFAIDYGLYAVGAAGGRAGFELVAGRAKNVPGLRWTGTSLGGTIARAQATIAAGYLLPNLVRGRVDRRVAIDLASLGLSTAAVEAMTHGMRAAAVRTSLGQRAASFLARHGRIARAGGWAVDVGQLVLVLYASEWLSDAVERPIIRWEARRALGSSWEKLRGAAGGRDDAAFAAALDDLDDAFDAYRNLISHDLEGALKTLNRDLQQAARKLHQNEAARARTENLPPALAASRERVMARTEAEADESIRAALARFEAEFGAAIGRVSTRSGRATLTEPGTSRPGLYELQLGLLAELEAQAPAARKAAVAARRETLARQRDLDAGVLAALVAGTGVGAPATVEEVAGTDGLLLHKVTLTARDTWHEETADRELLTAQPNKYAPAGTVRTRRLYHHDVTRDEYWGAPGVSRLDENGKPQESVALLDAPRPLTMKGRYNILRLPRGLLEPLAVGGAVFLRVELEWELSKVVRGAIVRPAEGKHAQVFRVQLGQEKLPTLPGLQGGYLDAHYHTIAEWYNPEPGAVADLELDAPRQKYGGPIPMLVESAWAVGAIDAPTYEAARDKLVTTDHNAFYVADDTLPHRPPYGPTSARESGGLTEHQRMRQLLGQSVGEELCYQKPGLGSVGVHMLDYRSRHYDGTWNAQEPVGRLWRRWTSPLFLPTMEGVLSDFAKGEAGNEHAFAFASHPVSSIPWEVDKLVDALSNYARASDKSFVFKGMQVWNARAGRKHSLNKLYKYVDDLNPFVSTSWQAGHAFDDDIHGALVRYRYLLRMFAAHRHPLDQDVRFVRKHYMVAGSDAHGDFNYTVGGLATVILALAGLNDRTVSTLELEDSAFMKIRNFVATEGQEAPTHMNALARGTSVVTDGPLVWFELDADGSFDAEAGVYDLSSAPRFKDREGRIGGSGAFDGGRTALLANDARPVFRYSYANYDEFGRPVQRDELGRPTRYDGTIDGIGIYKTDLDSGAFAAGTGRRLEANGFLDVHGGRAFGRAFTAPLEPSREGPVRSISAIQLGASTKLDANTSPADVYRCITNPIWAVKVDVVAHLDQAKFDAARGVILPGGLSVELRSPVSLAQDKLAFTIKALDARGKSGQAVATLVADGWADGVDHDGRPFKGGLLRATNRAELPLRGLARFSPPVEGGAAPTNFVTLVAITAKAPRDHFGNALNPVAAWFEVDPQTGAPGRHAVRRTDLTPVTFQPPTGRGIIEALPLREE